MTETHTEPVSEKTVEEMTESLTGFDEIAIGRHFDGFDMYSHAKHKPATAMRALVFVDQRRRGLADPEAKEHAMGLTFKEVTSYFVDQPEDLDPEEPDTDAGKGSERHA